MNKLTAFFLILLRLAIGWHFFAEGYHKLETSWRGPTETAVGKSKPFSSAGYFREGTGPLAQIIRQHVGDPDDEALALLTPESAESPNAAPHTRTPPRLHQKWNEYVQRISDYFDFNDEQRQKAEQALTKAEDDAVRWMTRTEADAKNLKSTTQEGRLPVPARLALYKSKLDELSAPKHSRLVSIGSDAESVRLHNVKAEAVRLRVSLLGELDDFSKDLTSDLKQLPTPEQKTVAEDKGKAPQPEGPPNRVLKWIDLSTIYGLTILGACLLLGLFSRTACLLSAGFLLSTYLCMPPFPWLPSAPNNEGYYLFVNKNVVEMLALLALATTRSGYWFGVDALIHWIFFGRRPPAAPAQPGP